MNVPSFGSFINEATMYRVIGLTEGQIPLEGMSGIYIVMCEVRWKVREAQSNRRLIDMLDGRSVVSLPPD